MKIRDLEEMLGDFHPDTDVIFEFPVDDDREVNTGVVECMAPHNGTLYITLRKVRA